MMTFAYISIIQPYGHAWFWIIMVNNNFAFRIYLAIFLFFTLYPVHNNILVSSLLPRLLFDPIIWWLTSTVLPSVWLTEVCKLLAAIWKWEIPNNIIGGIHYKQHLFSTSSIHDFMAKVNLACVKCSTPGIGNNIGTQGIIASTWAIEKTACWTSILIVITSHSHTVC